MFYVIIRILKYDRLNKYYWFIKGGEIFLSKVTEIKKIYYLAECFEIAIIIHSKINI